MVWCLANGFGWLRRFGASEQSLTRERRGVDCEVRVEGKGAEAIGSIAANHLICLAQEAIANPPYWVK